MARILKSRHFRWTKCNTIYSSILPKYRRCPLLDFYIKPLTKSTIQRKKNTRSKLVDWSLYAKVCSSRFLRYLDRLAHSNAFPIKLRVIRSVSHNWKCTDKDKSKTLFLYWTSLSIFCYNYPHPYIYLLLT